VCKKKEPIEWVFRHAWSHEPDKWYTPEEFTKEMKKRSRKNMKKWREEGLIK